MGPRVLQGPHQGAQKSTSTGASVDAAMTSCSKVARVVSIASSSIKRSVDYLGPNTAESMLPEAACAHLCLFALGQRNPFGFARHLAHFLIGPRELRGFDFLARTGDE